MTELVNLTRFGCDGRLDIWINQLIQAGCKNTSVGGRLDI